jgi:NTP pyrophosphatase (non-canonical NTP hydrolase)
MQMQELIDELKKINQRLLEGYDLDDKRVRILARTAKISEEVGELANELTAFILGITLDIDIEKAIKDRLNDINNRVHI